MALVPFRTRGPAADQRAEQRLFQVGGFALVLRQQPAAGMRMLQHGAADATGALDAVEVDNTRERAGGANGQASALFHGSGDAGVAVAVSGAVAPPMPGGPLGDVGLVAWQCGFVLADLMLRSPPLGAWHGVHVVDLGCGTGLVGIALRLAGARVVLTDLPHVLPLAEANAAANCERHNVSPPPTALPHAWGDACSAAALASPAPDIVTASDVLYDTRQHHALLATLHAICAPHTLVFVAWKKRAAAEDAFVGAAESAGWVVECLPVTSLAEEYQDGAYVVLRLCRLDAMDTGEDSAGDSGGGGSSALDRVAAGSTLQARHNTAGLAERHTDQ